MESRFESFLKSLSDHELAIYVGYQYEGLLPHSEQTVLNELELRGLSKKQLENYLNIRLSPVNVKEAGQCKRCGSDKFYEDVDTEYGNGKYTTHVYKVKTNRCRLCHLNPSKDPPTNFFDRVKWYLFGKNKSKTIKYIKTLDWFDD